MKDLLRKMHSVKLALMAHPDNQEDSEFADRISDIQEISDSFLKEEEILQAAINKYGTNHQLDMAIEECAELIQAINKVRRAGLVSYHITKPNMSMTLDNTIAYSNLCAEVADVKIMIAQLELMLDKDTIQKAYDTKIKRLSTIV